MDKPLAETRVFGSAGILVLTQLVTKPLGAVFTIAVARALGAEDFGLFSSAIAFGNLFGLLATFGFQSLLTREVARYPENTGDYLGRIIVIELIFSMIAVLAMLSVQVFLGYPPQRVFLVAIVGVTMLISALLNVLAAFFRAHQHTDLEAVMRFVLSALNMSMGLLIC